MLKLLGVVLIILGIMGIGTYEKRKMTEQIEWLGRLINVLSLLKEEITFSRKTLPEACYRVSSKCPDEEQKMLNSVYDCCMYGERESFGNVWMREAGDMLMSTSLSMELKNEFISFFNEGAWDMRVSELAFDRLCDKYRREAEETKKANTQKWKLFMSLASLAGAAVIILLW